MPFGIVFIVVSVVVRVFRKNAYFRVVSKNPQNTEKSQLLDRKKTRFLSKSGLFGGDKRDRTADLLNAIQALSRLDDYPPAFL